MEWNPEVVRRVRGAMQDRARSQACLFKAFSSVMTREQAEALAREGIAGIRPHPCRARRAQAWLPKTG